LWGEGDPLIDPGRLTLASMLKARGYATAGIGKWHLGVGWAAKPGATASTRTRNQIDWIDYTKPYVRGPRSLGFDAFFGIPASLDMPPYVYLHDDRVEALPTATLPGKPEGDPAFYRPGVAAPGFQPENVLRDLTSRAVDYIGTRAAAAGRRQPFFLYLALAAPHTPVMPSAAFQGNTGIGVYGDFVAETDAAVGQVLQALDAAGLTDRTLVLFASDNGPAPLGGIGEAAQRGHDASGGWRGVKAGLYEGGHRVPFVVRWPGVVPAGRVSTRVVGTTDVTATIADLIGAPIPHGAAEDSISFAENLRDPARDAVRSEALVLHSQNGSFAIREGRWKLILTHGSGADQDTPAGADVPPVQLFDLEKDPKETTNVATIQPAVVADLDAQLKKIRDEGRSRKR
jgi:arylsulfatase A-like enzyme